MGNAYSLIAPGSAYVPQYSYVSNPKTSYWLNVATLPAGTANLMVQTYDVVNAAATLPYDATAGAQNATVTNTANANMTNLPSITPSSSNGLVIELVSDGTGPVTGLVSPGPAAAVCDVILYTSAMTDANTINNGDGFAHYYNPSTSTINWAWSINTPVGSLPENSSGASVAFKGSATGPGNLGLVTMLAALGVVTPAIHPLIKSSIVSNLGISTARPSLPIKSTLASAFGITHATSGAIIKAVIAAGLGIRSPALLVNTTAALRFTEGITSAAAVQKMQGAALQFHEGISPAPVFTSGTLTAALEGAFGISHAKASLLISSALQARLGLTPGARIVAPIGTQNLIAHFGLFPPTLVHAIIMAPIQAALGVSPAPAMVELIKANIAARLGITMAQADVLLSSALFARFGIKGPAPVLSGGTAASGGQAFIFVGDGMGVRRIAIINPLTGD